MANGGRSILRFFLTLLIGLIAGAFLTLFLLGRFTRSTPLTGTPVTAPEATGDPAGTAVVKLDEVFFNTVLTTIFRDLAAPSFPLQLVSNANSPFSLDDGNAFLRRAAYQQPNPGGGGGGGCASSITLKPEGSGVKTGVRLTDGKILVPLAFSGNYNAPVIGCYSFQGTAQANFQMQFDAATQTIYGQIAVESVNVEGLNPLVGDVLTPLVQKAINDRVNPVTILRGQQLSIVAPVQNSAGTLRAQVKQVRSEVKDNTLWLHLTYDFTGQREGGGQPATQPTIAPPQS